MIIIFFFLLVSYDNACCIWICSDWIWIPITSESRETHFNAMCKQIWTISIIIYERENYLQMMVWKQGQQRLWCTRVSHHFSYWCEPGNTFGMCLDNNNYTYNVLLITFMLTVFFILFFIRKTCCSLSCRRLNRADTCKLGCTICVRCAQWWCEAWVQSLKCAKINKERKKNKERLLWTAGERWSLAWVGVCWRQWKTPEKYFKARTLQWVRFFLLFIYLLIFFFP